VTEIRFFLIAPTRRTTPLVAPIASSLKAT
jgi:hypothetical protein